MKKLQLPMAALALGLVLSANKCTTGDAGSSTASLATGKWELVSLYGSGVNMPAGSQTPFLNIDSLGTNVTGFAGCNRMFGAMSLHGDSISFPGLASTKMYCQETQQVEDRFLQALNETRTFTVKDGDLVLNGAQEVAVLRRSK